MVWKQGPQWGCLNTVSVYSEHMQANNRRLARRWQNIFVPSEILLFGIVITSYFHGVGMFSLHSRLGYDLWRRREVGNFRILQRWQHVLKLLLYIEKKREILNTQLLNQWVSLLRTPLELATHKTRHTRIWTNFFSQCCDRKEQLVFVHQR